MFDFDFSFFLHDLANKSGKYQQIMSDNDYNKSLLVQLFLPLSMCFLLKEVCWAFFLTSTRFCCLVLLAGDEKHWGEEHSGYKKHFIGKCMYSRMCYLWFDAHVVILK